MGRTGASMARNDNGNNKDSSRGYGDAKKGKSREGSGFFDLFERQVFGTSKAQRDYDRGYDKGKKK
jgi:hypothetical protein